MRGLLALVAAIVLVDTVFFAALAPLLPAYAAALGLSKAGVGILSGAFAVGVLAAALPSALVTGWLGARATVLLGLALTAGTSLAFGLADGFSALVLTRALGGIGSACSWTAAVSWLAGTAPRERRGELIGFTLSAAVAGALLGPVLGGLGATVGTPLAFGGIAALAAILAGWVWAAVAPDTTERPSPGTLLRALLEPRLRAGVGLTLLPPLLFGVLGVLAPLGLARWGWTAVMLGGLYAFTAALEAVVHPLLGRWADRRGSRAPAAVGLGASAAILLGLALAERAWALAGLVVLAGLAFGATLVPGMALLSRRGEETGIGRVLALAIANFAWALGNAVGGPVGGWVAEGVGDRATYLTLAALCAGLALVARGSASTPAAPAR